MLRPTLLAMLLVTCTSHDAFAQNQPTMQPTPQNTVVTPAPVVRRNNGIQADLSLGVIGLAYERVVHNNITLHIGAQYYRPWYMGQPVFGFGGELRAIFTLVHGPAPRGLYLSPFIRAAWATAEYEMGLGSGWSISAGITAGYSILVGGWFNLRLGPGIQYFVYDVTAGTNQYRIATFYPAVDIMVSIFF